jgi:hypothetical protein
LTSKGSILKSKKNLRGELMFYYWDNLTGKDGMRQVVALSEGENYPQINAFCFKNKQSRLSLPALLVSRG